jgi:hypothetical protein
MTEMRSPAAPSLSWLDGALFTALGALEGAFWLAVDPLGNKSLAGASLGVSAAAFVTAAFLVGRFTFTGGRIGSSAAIAGVTGTLVGLVTSRVWSHLPREHVIYSGDDNRILAWMIGAFVFLYVVTPFAQIYQGSGRFRFPYAKLFEHSWNNSFVGLVALLFTGVLWALLSLWGALFDVVGISLFEDLFSSRSFAYIATFAAFGYGLGVGRSSENVIATLRRIALMIARALLPLIALIMILFVFVLPFTGLATLWSTGRTTPLVLTLLGFFALLLNAVFEDGERPAPYVGLIRREVETAALVMPVYVAIAAHGTWLRVAQHGLTPSRVFALLFVSVAGMYGIGYAAAVIRRRPHWLQDLRSVNIAGAWLVAVLAILVQLWPLDPLRLSAEQQARRLLHGEVTAASFDFAALRFRLGHYGVAQLQRLEDATTLPESDAIREAVEKVRAARNAWELEHGPSREIHYGTLPAGVEVPSAVVNASREMLDRGWRQNACDEPTTCTMLAVDLDGDGALEFCLLGERGGLFGACWAGSESQGWRQIGGLAYRGEGLRPSLDEISRAVGSDGGLQTRSPRFMDLVVPGGVLQVVPLDFEWRRPD